MRIGLFLRNLDEEFQITVFRGIRAKARTEGVDLVCVQGETIQAVTQRGRQPFELAKEIRFDGILILSSVVIDTSDPRQAALIPSVLPPIPVVSVGLKVPGLPSLTIQSKRPLARILEHLILDHGYRRFLYLGGPELHHDNQIREAIFLKTLQDFSTSWPDLEAVVEHGGFSEQSAMEIIRNYLPGHPFDAVVAANDNMALGVLKVLKLQNDPLWRRCAVTGFDDIPQAALEEPSLTTVHQPLDGLGALALETVVDLVKGAVVPGHRRIVSRPVIRESCGCQTGAQPATPTASWVERTSIEQRIDGIRRAALDAEQKLRMGNYFGRDMSAVSTQHELITGLDRHLQSLGVGDFYLLVEDVLWYERRNHETSNLPEGGLALTLEQLFTTRPFRLRPSWDFCVFHLRSGDETVGLAVYSAEDRTLPHVGSVLPHVAHAIKRLRTQVEQLERNRRLEAMVKARTIELTQLNEWLRAEVELRAAKEAEVQGQRRGLELILQTLPIPVAVFDQESGLILYANHAFEDRIGGPGSTQSIHQFLDLPDVCEGVELNLRSAVAGGATVPVLAYTASLDFDGKRATLAAMVDLSRQKALEAEVLQISEFERRRFGLDLHDDTCQRLAGITMYIKGFVKKPVGDPWEILQEVGGLVDEAFRRTRLYAHESFPIDLERRGLDSVLRQLCETVSNQTGRPCRYLSDLATLQPPLAGHQALNLYRIVQEALQNASKHSGASNIEVSAEVSPAKVVLKVADNGSGLAPVRDGSEGLGFRSMAYRASQLGARFDVSSRPGRGTVVTVEVPR